MRINNKKSGFTLIELLVVISIISLLSSVVLSSVNSARSKAQTVSSTQRVNEFIKALYLYKDDHNTFPIPTIPGKVYCVGVSNCLKVNGFVSVGSTDPTFSSALSPYLGNSANLPKMMDKNVDIIIGGLPPAGGLTYSYSDAQYECPSGNCQSLIIDWAIPIGQNCQVSSATTINGTNGASYCALIIN